MNSLDNNTIIVINIDENGVLTFWDDNAPYQLKVTNYSDGSHDFESNFSKSIIDLENKTEENENAQGWSEI